jgi:hypothetical protein
MRRYTRGKREPAQAWAGKASVRKPGKGEGRDLRNSIVSGGAREGGASGDAIWGAEGVRLGSGRTPISRAAKQVIPTVQRNKVHAVAIAPGHWFSCPVIDSSAVFEKCNEGTA